MWGRKRWYTMSPGALKTYAWLELITLPFKFILSEFFYWNKAQLNYLAKCHQIFMSSMLVLLIAGITVTLWAVQHDGYQELQRAREERRDQREHDQQNTRISNLEAEQKQTNKDVQEMRLELKGLTTAIYTLIGLLRDSVKLLGWLIGFVGLGSVIRLAGQVFGIKWRYAYKEAVQREKDPG